MATSRVGTVVLAVGSLSLLLACATESQAAADTCALAVSSQGPPKAGDALGVLKSAVGSRTCALCTCDVDRSGKISATDALLTLRFAVGQPVALKCVACPVHATIGAAGGTVTAADGRFEVEFPPGALSTNTEITVSGLAPSLRDPATNDFGVTDVYVVEPQGLELNVPAEGRLKVGLTTLPDGTHSYDLFNVLATYPGAAASSLRDTRGVEGVEYVRVVSAYGGGFFYVPGSDVVLRIGLGYLAEYDFSPQARFDAYVPEVLSVGAKAFVTGQFTGYPTLGSYAALFTDQTANGFLPFTGTPLTTDPVVYDAFRPAFLRIPYTCDSPGTYSFDGQFSIPIQLEETTQEDTADVEGEVECTEPLVLGSHLFPWACLGTTDALTDLAAGAKIVCPVSGPTQSGYAIYEPEIDEDDEPFAIQVGGFVVDSGAQYKLAIMKDPGGGEEDAFFTAGEGYQFLRFSQKGVDVIGTDPLKRSWYDIAPTIVPGLHPSVLMTNSTEDSFYRAEYDGSANTVTPLKILDHQALTKMGLGELISGKLMTPTGPVIGITGAIGQSPGSIFVHDLVNPTAAVTIVGPTGKGPECIHCDAGLCAVTNGLDDSMTVVKWGGSGPASILGTVPIGDLPNGSEVRWLGGSRHLVLTTGRLDNSVTLTVIDTEADDIVESRLTMPTPGGCQFPAFIDFLDENDSVVFSCQNPGTIGLLRGVVPH